jgi:LPXTG-motif cell wall-anchored protein
MKRLWILITLMALVLSLPLSASADLIYQPRDDFFDEYWDECNQYDKTHIANGADGHVTIYKTPKDLQILGTIPNGEKVYVAWTYTAEDGIDWGCVKLWDEGIEGWIPMSPNYVASPPSGISPTTILIVAGAVAVISGGLLVVLKKKKK